MSDRFAGDSFGAYLRDEAAQAERFIALVRLVVLVALFAINLVFATFSELVRSHLLLTVALFVITGAYTLGAYGLAQWRYHPALGYATTAVDVALLTLFIFAVTVGTGVVAVATKTVMALVYFPIIVATGLRLSVPLTLFAAALSAVAFLGLLVPIAAADPGRFIFEFSDYESGSVSLGRITMTVVLLLVVGAGVALQTKRSRDLVRRSLHTVTFLYADLRGFTSFVESRGDAAGAGLVAEYRRVVRAEIARAGGRELKTEGDSFLVEFRTARQALQCATGILGSAEVRSRERPDLPLRIGVGVHAGEPIRFEQDYIGSAVNLTARLGQTAEAGELLASDVVRGLLRTSGAPPAREREGLALKGIPDPPRVYSFDWRSGTDHVTGRDERSP